VPLVSSAEQLPQRGDVLIFGAGEGGRIVLAEFRRGGGAARVVGFIDNNKSGEVEGLPVFRPDAVSLSNEGTRVVVASMFAGEIADQLRHLGVTELWNAAPLIRNVLHEREARARGPLSVLGDLAREVVLLVAAVLVALAARRRTKPIQVGIGPDCLVNNRWHKRALERVGIEAETFVIGLSHVTRDFDHIFLSRPDMARDWLVRLRAFRLMVNRYRVVFLYFTGGPLAATRSLWRIEPLLLALAGTRVVVMPFGSDIQDFSRTRNLAFKHAHAADYPYEIRDRQRIADKIDLWTENADHVISGCDWVDYTHHWDTLMSGHFAIDVDEVIAKTAHVPPPDDDPTRPLVIVHTPNHRAIKGTAHLIAAVERLRAEGYAVDLRIVEFASNLSVLEKMAAADVVFDQLVIGWYAMVALEGMALGKPVITRIRPDLLELYETTGCLEPGELPLIDADHGNLTDVLRGLLNDRRGLRELGERGRAFVRRRHSLEHVGGVFSDILRRIDPEGFPVRLPSAVGSSRAEGTPARPLPPV